MKKNIKKNFLKNICNFVLDFLDFNDLLNVCCVQKNIFCGPHVFSLGQCNIKNSVLQNIKYKKNSLLQFYHSLEVYNPSLGSLQKTLHYFPNVSTLKLKFQKTIIPFIKETKKKKINLKKYLKVEIIGSLEFQYIQQFLSYLKI